MQSNPTNPEQPPKTARPSRTARPRLRFAIDALIGLAVYLALSVAMLGPSAAGSLLGIEARQSFLADGSTPLPLFVTNPANAWDWGGTNINFLMFAAVFSALFALNNAFVRHLRKAYIRSHKRGSGLAGRLTARD